MQYGGMRSAVYSLSDYGQWTIQVSGKLSASEKQVRLNLMNSTLGAWTIPFKERRVFRLEPSLPTVYPLSWLLFSLSSKSLLLCEFIQNIFAKKKNEGEIYLAEKAGDRWAFPETCSFCAYRVSHTIMPWVRSEEHTSEL